MFHRLIRDLHKAFPGNEIYMPEPLHQLVHKWLIAQGKIKGSGKQVRFKGKKILAYDESAVHKAYQLTPIHVPRRIMEKASIMEFSLPEDNSIQDTPVPEEPNGGRTVPPPPRDPPPLRRGI